MSPLPSGAAKSEGHNQIPGRPHTADSQAKPKPKIKPNSLATPKPHTVTLDSPHIRRGRPGVELIARRHSVPSLALSVELLIRHFESLVQDGEDPRLGFRQRAVTAPAPNLRGRYHSALNSRRRSGTRHPPATAIVEKVAEESLSHANPETNTSGSASKASSLKMWPFANGEGNHRIEPLVPAEDGSASNQQDARRNSTPKVDQQEPSRSLRPSRSLSSLKVAAQPRGLHIPPGAAVSQSSDVCAQGEVTSTPLKADKCEQPPSEQTAQEHEHVPASANDMNPSPSGKDNVRNETGHDPDLASTDGALEAASITSPASADSKQSSSPTDVRDYGSQSAHIIKSTESEEPELPVAVEKLQPSTPKPLPEGDNETLRDDLSSHETVQQTWPVTSTNAIESHAADDPPQNSSISAPIPTIRVQQTTESDETAPRSELLASENTENRPSEAPEKVLEAPGKVLEAPEKVIEASTDSSHVPAPASVDIHMQHDAASPRPSTPTTVPEIPGDETRSAADPSVDKVTDKLDSDHPGLAKLAIRKARNLAGSRFVLSILLGRELADQTKPQLEELARPPIKRVGRTAPAPGPSQVDGLAELDGDLESDAVDPL
ncbi:hypothetical protein EPUS_03893 [Endocarpon pusillum Z07020]|uniref:Uncharacterized protein n=1 Tax=Endocarpon pusillum (strain Z07020 / HMAS-L-300199) TaxID=1263415 RepID=U1HUW3_ENDPU|nr:uncharacterized protein EPUS_03893 [Endocarpon pusillum Z07020]ERF74455.1 hypothetical protein EPUS_03893 [Endocarpon pusillum Z07020]